MSGGAQRALCTGRIIRFNSGTVDENDPHSSWIALSSKHLKPAKINSSAIGLHALRDEMAEMERNRVATRCRSAPGYFSWKADLWRRSRRAALTIVVLALAILFVGESARVCLSDEWAGSADTHLWKWAANLDADNATAWYRMGTRDAEGDDPGQSLRDFERAARVDPHSALIWMALAESLETAGNPGGARAAFENARRVFPISPEVAWRFGNFLLRRDDIAGALAEFRRALQAEPSLSWNVLAECQSAGISPGRALTDAFPLDVDLYFAAIGYYSSRSDFDAALSAWERLNLSKQPFPLPKALPLVDRLIFHGREQDAARVWREALAASHWPVELAGGGSIAFNGGFEKEPLDGGFDWEIGSTAGATFSLDRSQYHSGLQSLRVSFDGSSNIDLGAPQEFVPVDPGRRYQLSAWLRTEGISTDSGVGFEIRDYDAGKQARTNGLTGTHSWTNLSASLCSGPHTHLLLIELRRSPSEKFDNQLRGAVWIDDVSLVPGARCSLPGKEK